MATVPQLQIPGYSAPVDVTGEIGSLANLGKVYKQAQIDTARRQTLADLGSGSGPANYQKAIGSLAALGDLEGATKIAAIQKSLAPETSSDMQAFRLAQSQGYKGGILDFLKDKAAAGATRINNTIQSGEKAYDTTVGKDYGETFTGLQKGGRDAVKAMGTLDLMENLTKDPNFYSGFGGDLALRANQALVGFGIKDPKAASATETFRALGNQTVLDAAGGSLGNQISNGDRDYINATTANLANTPEGNRELIGIRRKLATRQQETARLARDYAKSHGGRIDAGFDDYLANWVEKNPLFPRAPQVAPKPAANDPAEGSTATNPQTGERLIRRGGKWVPFS